MFSRFARGIFLLLVAYFSLTVTVVLAEDRDLKTIIAGFEDYKAFGGKKAASTWLKYGPQENTDYSIKVIDALSNAERLNGDFIGYEVLKKYKWSNNVIYFFVLINYDKGPLFAKFMLYKYRNETITYGIELDTNPEIIMPEFYLNRTGLAG